MAPPLAAGGGAIQSRIGQLEGRALHAAQNLKPELQHNGVDALLIGV